MLDQLVEFAGAAVERAAEESGRKVVLVGNSLGGWVALRAAGQLDLPLAGVVPIGPAGIDMAPFFFTADRIPVISRLISLPAPVPAAVVKSVVGRFYRTLAYAEPNRVDQVVVDRFTRQNLDRAEVSRRIGYAKRIRSHLADPVRRGQIDCPVTVIWGERDRLCMPKGAARLAELLPQARIEMLEGVGHTPQIEAPDVVVAAIARPRRSREEEVARRQLRARRRAPTPLRPRATPPRARRRGVSGPRVARPRPAARGAPRARPDRDERRRRGSSRSAA